MTPSRDAGRRTSPEPTGKDASRRRQLDARPGPTPAVASGSGRSASNSDGTMVVDRGRFAPLATPAPPDENPLRLATPTPERDAGRDARGPDAIRFERLITLVFRHATFVSWIVLPVVATILRLAYVATLPPTNIVTFEADPITYDQIARNILSGRGYSGASFYYPPGSDTLTSFWDPLYPYFLATIYAVAGPSIPAVRIVQSIIGGVSVGLIAHVGTRLGRTGTGLIASAWATIYPFFFYYTGQLLTETLYIGLILATVALGIEAIHRRHAGWFVALGIAGGLASLGRAEAFAFTIAYVAWCATRSASQPASMGSGDADAGGNRSPREGQDSSSWGYRGRISNPTPRHLMSIRFASRWVPLIAVGWLAMAVPIAPWAIRNYLTFDRPILTTTKLGYNLYKYYHPLMTADQTVRTVPFPDFGTMTEPERADLMQRIGIGYMLEDPVRTATFMVSKFFLLFKLTPSNDATRGYALVSLLSYGILLPFMAAGAVLGLLRGKTWWPLLGYVAFNIASKTAVFAGIRLRMQIEPFLLILAAFAVVRTAESVRASQAPWLLGARHRLGFASPPR